MTNRKAHGKASQVQALPDGVHLDGPDGVAVTLTPRAALETARRMGDAAVEILIEEACAPEQKRSPRGRTGE